MVGSTSCSISSSPSMANWQRMPAAVWKILASYGVDDERASGIWKARLRFRTDVRLHAIDRRMIGGSWMFRKLSSLGGVRINWALTNI